MVQANTQLIPKSNLTFGPAKVTHTVCIRGKLGAKPDNKAFSVCAKGFTSKQLHDILLEFKEKHFHKIFSQDIMFTDDINIESSHQVVIMPRSIDSSGPSKSFSIKLTSHSSEEIAEVLKIYLYGEGGAK